MTVNTLQVQPTKSSSILSPYLQEGAESVPIMSQRVGGNLKTLLDGVEANTTGDAVVWEGGVATVLAYADDGAAAGAWGSGSIALQVRRVGRTKWIALKDSAGAAIAFTEDTVENLTIGAGLEIRGVLTGATSPDPIYLEIV